MSLLTKIKNDIIYLILLLLSVAAGFFYRKLNSALAKKWVGTALGIVLIILVSGVNAFHPLLAIILGITSIKISPIQWCHVTTFVVMFSYLFFFRLTDNFGLPIPSGQVNLILMILVLKITGVAFEINGSHIWVGRAKKNEKNEKSEEIKSKDDDFVEIINPSLIDLVHYSLNYIGLLTGPYYRYRTWDDYLHLPFCKHVDCTTATINSLKLVPLYISLYLGLSSLFPVDYVLTEEHNSSSFVYRAMYPWMIFAQFRQRIYCGMTLAECVCTAAGLGAYPVRGKNRTGHGPTDGYLELKKMSDEQAQREEYDFNTIVSVDAIGCETVVTFRDSMKVWNKAVQYWIGMYVFKRFPVKVLKMHVALFVSVIWHGFHAGYFFCIYFCPFYVAAEDIYVKLFYKNATGMSRQIWSFILWFFRGHFQSYQTAAFLLLSFDKVWRYYTSMHHYLYLVWAVLLAIGLVLQKLKGKPHSDERKDLAEKLVEGSR